MIKVRNLTKIYKDKKFSVTALDGVSFMLPDAGIVFVVGKSGSGKSTLLNLLGGLDSATEGSIVVDGMEFSAMKSDSSFDGYRARYLGFVFQDFHLIPKLTVGENVKLVLELKGEDGAANVKDALLRVGLEGYEGRYPAEMSGGQQQRVAIARAIVKDPRLILADEPTGNLDSMTSKQILDLLKELSKDRLVVVVSHNMEAANTYANRIIELGDGKIVRDVTRVEGDDHPLIEGDVITLPDGRLDDEQLRQVNEAVKKGAIVTRCRERFEPTRVEANEISAKLDENADEASAKSPESAKISSEKPSETKKAPRMPFKESARLCFGFLNVPSLITAVLVTALTVMMFVICLEMYTFDGSAIFKGNAANTNGVTILQKDMTAASALDSVALNKIYRVEDGDEEAFRKLGYEGNIFKLYNMAVVNGGALYSGMLKGEMKRQDKLYGSIYADEALGVLVTNEDYLKKQFGEIEVLAGALDAEPYGVIITDYFADSMLKADPTLVTADAYGALLGKDKSQYTFKYYINAVIKTDYKKKHAKLFEMYNDLFKDGLLSEKDKTTLATSDEYAAFLTDAQTRLNIAYSINENYIEATRQTPQEARNIAYIFNANIFEGGTNGALLMDSFNGSATLAGSKENGTPKLEKGEAYLSRNFYNQLFGTHITSENDSEFEQKTITIVDYEASDIFKQAPISTLTLTVTATWGEYGYMYISDEDFDCLREKDVFAYSLVFDSTTGIENVLDGVADLGYVPNAGVYSDMLLVSRVMKVYADLFLALSLILLGVGLIMLIAFAVRSVRGRVYEIGILRSLGASLNNVAGVFLLQMLFAGALVCVVTVIGQAGLITVANGLITTGLASFMHNGTFKSMTLIRFDAAMMAISLAAVVLITLLSAIIPIIKLARIKPMEILRKKD